METIYPERAPYPNEMEYLDQKTGDFDDKSFRKVYDAWREDQRIRREGTDYTDDLTGFLTQSIPQFLSGAAGENRVYSPLNVYMALSMLAELTDGSSHASVCCRLLKYHRKRDRGAGTYGTGQPNRFI